MRGELLEGLDERLVLGVELERRLPRLTRELGLVELEPQGAEHRLDLEVTRVVAVELLER